MSIRDESGFSLTEVLIASALTLTVMAVAMTGFRDLSAAADAAALTADVNTTLRTAMNLMMRDLISTGRGIPVGGVPIPSGDNAEALVRPSPGDQLEFEGLVTLPAVSHGASLGPEINDVATDMITILMSDTRLPADMPLIVVAADGLSAVVDGDFPVNDPADGIAAGDLMLVANANDRALVMVTGRDGQALSFAAGDAMRLNQPDAAQGTLARLQNEDGTYPQTSATRVLMISYYIDASDPDRPRLVRRVNLGPERTIAVGITNLQITYDLIDGGDNPVNVQQPEGDNTPHQIRKANIVMMARSYRQNDATRQYVTGSLTAQVSLRSLAFVDRYGEEE
jgi:hypothetical protein